MKISIMLVRTLLLEAAISLVELLIHLSLRFTELLLNSISKLQECRSALILLIVADF